MEIKKSILAGSFLAIILYLVSCSGNNKSQQATEIPRSVIGINLCSTKDSVVVYLKERGLKYEILSKEHIYVDLEHSVGYEGISLNLYFIRDKCFGMAYQPTKSRTDFDIIAQDIKNKYPMQNEHKGIGENGDNVLYSYSNLTTTIKLRTDFGSICYYDNELDSINRQNHPEDY